MTVKEALLFFPHNQEDDLLDLYEERLFEYKQFFISKPLIEKVFLAKEKKMMQMHDAFILFQGDEINKIEEIQKNTYAFSENILESFNYYQRIKNQIKNAITNSKSAIELSIYSMELIFIHYSYSEKWIILDDLNKQNILISIEPDPMNILKSILEFNSKGGFLFEDLNTKRNILPEMLINEAKRLSLCRKLIKK